MSSRWPPIPHVHKASGKERLIIYQEGKRHDFYLGPPGSEQSRRAYLRILGEIEAAGGYLPLKRGQPFLIKDLARRYTEWAYRYYVESSREYHTLGVALRFLLAKYEDTEAVAFGPLALKAVRADLEKSGYARVYCNKLLGRIKRIFRWAVSEELIPEETSRRLETVGGLRRGHSTAREVDKIKPITDDIIDRTLPYLGPVIQAMIRFQRLTGCRPGEVCLLRPCDLNQDWKELGEVMVWLYSLNRHKTDWRGAPCWIPIGPRAQKILAPYLKRDPEAYCFSPKESMLLWEQDKRARRKTKVQPSQLKRKRKRHPKKEPGDCFTTNSYRQAIHRACKAHNIPKWAPNQIRKRLATEVQNEHDRDTARCVLRHREASVTDRYVDDVEKSAKVIAQMG